MGYKSISIKKVLTYLNNPIEQGGFWIPNVQREFIWKEEQIEKFFNLIMKEYPIGLFLILKTKKQVKYRRFVSTYSEGVNTISNAEPITDTQKLLILDGQQRFQSLFIALNGSYNGKELYFDVLSGRETDIDGIKYKFKFIKESEADAYWVKVKDVVNSNYRSNVTRRHVISEIKRKSNEEMTEEIKTIIDDNLDQLINCLVNKKAICYNILDNVEHNGLYTNADICEIVSKSNLSDGSVKKDELMMVLE